MSTNTTVGFIGLGKMGTPMSQHLLKAGYMLKVYNRTKEKEETLIATGAIPVNSPAELMRGCSFIIIMVSDDAAIRSIFTGQDGLIGSNATDRIIINMSTVSPAISKEMADLCARKGNHYLDAPVSGSVKQAEEGTLVIMVGGVESVFNQAKPILDKLGRLTMHVGPTGAGNTAKLAINTLLAFYAQGLAEAVAFAQQNSIDPAHLLTLIGYSALSNVFTKIKGDAILQDNYAPAFALKHIAKDLRLARDLGIQSPLGRVAIDTFQQAEPMYGEEDIISVIKWLQRPQ